MGTGFAHGDNISPAGASNLDGRLEVFAVDASGHLVHSWQLAPNSAWSGWGDLSPAGAGVPVVARNPDGRLEVFTIFAGVVFHAYQLTDAQTADARAGELRPAARPSTPADMTPPMITGLVTLRQHCTERMLLVIFRGQALRC